MPMADMNTYMVERRKKRREFVIDFLGGECVRCGTTDRLEIDHIDRTTKVEGIANMLSHSMENLLVELEKCQLLCHALHIEKGKEAGDMASGGGHNKLPVPPHGTGARYNMPNGCRCSRCREAKRIYRMGGCANRQVVA
jgi:hypothetical protein